MNNYLNELYYTLMWIGLFLMPLALLLIWRRKSLRSSKNQKVIILLGALFVMVGVHFILARAYEDSYDYMAKNYHDADLSFYTYEMTLLAIIGEIGLASCHKFLLKALFFLLLIPNVLFVTFMLAAFSINQGDAFIALDNYHDYLFWLPFFADILLLPLGMYLLSSRKQFQ